MTLDEYHRSPVYVVQVYTAWVCRSIEPCGRRSGFHRLRILPAYRRVYDLWLRRQVAAIVRAMRGAGLSSATIRAMGRPIIDSPRGYAERVDVERELERMRKA